MVEIPVYIHQTLAYQINMALNIKNSRTHRLARELAEATGETLTSAVSTALEERLARVRGTGTHASMHDAVREIQRMVARVPDRDSRTPEELIGYDEHGLPL